ncbi:MAG TPA: hypothetical protein VGJ60_34175 [Chloroflexota bacterium]
MTQVDIHGDSFWIDGAPTYAGRTWRDLPLEGLLLNARMVQATFDDLNPETRGRWIYPDTAEWDPQRNVREFVSMLPVYRQHGLLAVTLNFQGGSPEGYSRQQPWENSAFGADGTLRPDYADRMRQAIDAADQCGMVVILGFFYQGQDERLADESAVVRAVDAATDFLLEGGWRNVLVEINNECNTRYEHPILQPERVHELIARVQTRSGRRLLASTSYGGRGRVADAEVARTADFVLLHGNGTPDPDLIAEQVTRTREVDGYRGQPILFNEDDHFDFDQAWNNGVAAVSRHASWGFFDPGEGAGGSPARGNYIDGYQLVPVNWGINTERKRGFFDLVREMTTR